MWSTNREKHTNNKCADEFIFDKVNPWTRWPPLTSGNSILNSSYVLYYATPPRTLSLISSALSLFDSLWFVKLTPICGVGSLLNENVLFCDCTIPHPFYWWVLCCLLVQSEPITRCCSDLYFMCLSEQMCMFQSSGWLLGHPGCLCSAVVSTSFPRAGHVAFLPVVDGISSPHSFVCTCSCHFHFSHSRRCVSVSPLVWVY